MREFVHLCASALMLLALHFSPTQAQVNDPLCPPLLAGLPPMPNCPAPQCFDRTTCPTTPADAAQNFVSVCCQFGLITTPCRMCTLVQNTGVVPPTPAPPAGGCVGVICPAGLECRIQNAAPNCVTPTGVTCTGNQCPAGSVCEIITPAGGTPFINCRLLTMCPALTITNAVLSSTSTSIDTTVSITCNAGFTRVGAASITCRASGAWEPVPPMCQGNQCPILTPFPNGIVSTTAVTQGTQVFIQCNPGFTIVGQASIVCANGNWLPTVPVCQAIPCPAINIQNAIISTTAVTQGTTVNIICQQNFRLVGAPTVICNNGAWNPTLPVCQANVCPALFPFPNGILSTNAVTPGTQVSIQCNNGFAIDGTPTIICANGAWQPRVPVCRAVVVTCPVLNIANAVISSQATNIGAVVSIQCASGFVLEGQSNQIVCQPNGAWNPGVPICRRVVQCPVLPPQANVRNDDYQGNRQINSIVQFVCATGYRLDGPSSLRCQSNGQWDGQPPVCRRVVQCPVLPPQGGVRNDNYQGNRQINTIVQFSCVNGYQLDGSSTLRCQSNGQWDGQPPVCRRVLTCRIPDPSPNGRVDDRGGNGSPGSVILYICNPGFVIQGPGQGICQNGQYNPPPPPCAVASCNVISAPANGRVNVTGGRLNVGDYLGFICNAGFRIQGSSTLRCQDNGAYDRPPPVCIAAPRCPVLQPQPQVRQDTYQGDRQVNTVVTFSCATGYQLDGRSSLRCQENGQWDGQAPVCRISGCPPVPGIANGRADTSNTALNTRARYTCDNGFVLRGNEEIFCRQNGNNPPAWDRAPPQCVRAPQCPVLQPQPSIRQDNYQGDRQVNSVVSFSCVSGYQLDGPGSLRCQQNGQWNGPVPMCRIIGCPQVPGVANGRANTQNTQLGTVVRYACDPGFTLSGNVEIVCRRNQNQQPIWDRPPPQCNRVINVCPPTPQIANGRASSGANNVGDRVEYTCNPGFLLAGSNQIVCTRVGANQAPRWSPNPPVCNVVVIRDCGPLPNLANAAAWAPGLPTVVGTVVSVSCNMGFNPQIIMATCTQQGRWMYSSGCTAIMCPPVSPPQFGVLSQPSNGNRLGSTITVSCNQGYQLAGPNTLECQQIDSGYRYSPSVPPCIQIMCMTLIPPTFGRVNVANNRPGTTARYACDAGYNLIGSETRRCGNNGQWSGSAPACQPVDCGNTLPNLANVITRQVPPGAGTSFPRTINVNCADGFMPETIQVTCSQRAQWEAVQSCVALPRCPTLRQPNQAGMTINGFTITFTCGPGFVLQGPATITCINGRWSSLPPVCIAVEGCPILSDPQNGRVRTLNGDGRPGTRVEFECFNGFTRVPEGSRILTCLRGNQWDRPVPTCVAISQCSQFANPQFGSVRVGQDQAGRTVATFQCNINYQLSGPAMLTCVNGIWNGPAPTCVPRGTPSGVCDNTCNRDPGNFVQNGCDEIPNPANGCRCYDDGCTATNRICRVSYRCFPGYVIQNNPGQRSCQSNRQWSSVAATCVPVGRGPCRTTIPINQGTTRISGNVLEVLCNPGYALNGPRQLECGPDGLILQNAPLPTCVRTAQICAPLSIADGSFVSNGATPGAQGRVTCNPGYGLANPGLADVVCQADGRWSNTPVCTRAGNTQCRQTLTLVRGTVRYVPIPGGLDAFFTCSPGFTLQGPTQLRCQNGPNAAFNGNLPVCVRGPTGVTCPSLTINGVRVSYSRNGEVQSIATFVCTADNRPLATTSTCQPSGNWLPSPPTSCGPIAPPSGDSCQRLSVNGAQVTYSDNNRVIPGTVAIINCLASGAVPDNNVLRVQCLPNGQWNQAPPTRCVGGAPSGDTCQRFSVDGGNVVFDPLNGNRVAPGTIATVQCPGDSTPDTNNRVQCQPNGQWSPARPTRCVRPGPARNCGAVRFNTNGGSVQYTAAGNPGSVATFLCNGATFSQSTCTNGQWLPAPPNTCPSGPPPQGQNCPMANLARDVTVRYSNAGNPGSTAQFLCGQAEIARAVCVNGRWDPNPPTSCSGGGQVRP